MEVSKKLICACNNKLYASSASFKAHQKSGIHLLWELPKQIKDLEIRATRLDNENSLLRRLNIMLMEKIQEVKK
jgi:hypothetical protein